MAPARRGVRATFVVVTVLGLALGFSCFEPQVGRVRAHDGLHVVAVDDAARVRPATVYVVVHVVVKGLAGLRCAGMPAQPARWSPACRRRRTPAPASAATAFALEAAVARSLLM